MIIDYCAAYMIVTTTDITDDPHPVLLSMADNTSADFWTNHPCKRSFIGKLLAIFVSVLLIDYTLGVNSKRLSTTDNCIADEVSRLKKLHASSSKQFSFEYSLLRQKYPQLKSCRFFQPSPDLLSCLWDILVHKTLSSLNHVNMLKQSGLGKLTT